MYSQSILLFKIDSFHKSVIFNSLILYRTTHNIKPKNHFNYDEFNITSQLQINYVSYEKKQASEGGKTSSGHRGTYK